ncbi:MAG: zf-HC2 domain-containing protein [Thermaerobacter sp.]|nr:zf-HC2 domain-containing protein [Thermaerobacter sp.]
MHHEACRDSLPLWVAGARGPVEAQAVQQHLAACGACRVERGTLTTAVDECATAAAAPD